MSSSAFGIFPDFRLVLGAKYGCAEWSHLIACLQPDVPRVTPYCLLGHIAWVEFLSHTTKHRSFVLSHGVESSAQSYPVKGYFTYARNSYLLVVGYRIQPQRDASSYFVSHERVGYSNTKGMLPLLTFAFGIRVPRTRVIASGLPAFEQTRVRACP